MIATPICRSSHISQNSGVVNSFSIISTKGYNVQKKEFVKRFLEKSLSPPDAQIRFNVNSISEFFLKTFKTAGYTE